MFNFPIIQNEKRKIYSFGKVVEVIGNIYCIQYKNNTLKIKYDLKPLKNEFVMFNGKAINKVVICEYLEIIEGIDYNILEKFVLFLNKYIQK